ncbi:unnamed protein product [Lactuca virosa]|uniref:Uncharacterized protein n=1 Tax=Lactuca virosa TaxID=75947 RepID=A0AAU9M8Q5_9ASTR|nr:unnamed protein product [Lactuca virosa]
MVAEDHVAPYGSNLSLSVEVADDDDDDDDDGNDDDHNDDDDNDVNFRFFVPPKELVNEAVITPAETKSVINIFKQPNNPTPEQMEALVKELQSNARKPPQAVSVTFESPSENDKDEPNASLMPKKRRQRDPRSGVLITKPVREDVQSLIVEPAQVLEVVQSPITEPPQNDRDEQGPIFDEDFLVDEEVFSSGSSSDPPRPEHDVTSIKLAKLLAFQDSIPQSRGNESIEKDLLIGKLDVRVSKLEKENSHKNKQISKLQANLGGLTAFYFDLKDKLIRKFGDKVQMSSSDDGNAPEASKRVVISLAPDSNIDQFVFLPSYS